MAYDSADGAPLLLRDGAASASPHEVLAAWRLSSPSVASGFSFNIRDASRVIMFHWNPRPDTELVVVMNDHALGYWRGEERISCSTVGIFLGRPMHAVVALTPTGFDTYRMPLGNLTALPTGSPIHTFRHRVPIERLHHVWMAAAESVHVSVVRYGWSRRRAAVVRCAVVDDWAASE
jgi:hypothetical protein